MPRWTTFAKAVNGRRLLELLVIISGTALTALAYYWFLRPNDIMAPGLGGVVVLIGHFVPVSLGIIYFVLNIPLFGFGLYFVGFRFILYSFIGMAALSFFLSLFGAVPGLHQPVLGSIFGGLMSGAALSVVLAAGGSTGGMDIVCVIVNRRWPKLTIGRVMVAMNAVVVLGTGLVFGLDKLLLTTLSIFLAGKTLDFCYEAVKDRTEGKEMSV